MEKDIYIVVQWPEVQDLMGKEGFLENCHLINDYEGYKQFGDSAYFVRQEWLNKQS